MKICFKRINIIKVFVYLWLICNAEFLYVEPIGNALNRISTYHNKILVTLICIFIFILSMTGITPHGKKYSLIEMELMLLLLFVCCIFLIQLFSNEVSVVDGLSKSYYFFVLLGYIGLAGSCKKYPQLFGWIVNISIKIGTLYAFVNIIFYLVFFYFGIILSYIPMLQQINNGMRIPRSSDFIQYTLVIYMIEIAEGNKRKGNYLGALICSIELIFVAQVRMALVVCGLVLVMIICI